MIRNLSSSPTLSAAYLDRQFGRGRVVRGSARQSSGSGQLSVKPSFGDRVYGDRVWVAPVQDGRGLSDRAPSKHITGNRIRNRRISTCHWVESRIRLERSNRLDWFIDLPNLGQFLSFQDRWQRSGRYSMTVLQED